MIRGLSAGLFLLLGIGANAATDSPLSESFNPAAVAYPRFDGDHYLPGGWLNIFEQECQTAAKAKEAQVVFLGDSITEGWNTGGKSVWDPTFSAYHPENFGISGDRTESLLWRLEKGLLQPALSPKVFVLLIGTNNIGQPVKYSNLQIADGIEKIIRLLREKRPESKILLYAIFPRGEKKEDLLRIQNEKINEIIRSFADGKYIFWVDLTTQWLNADGTQRSDLFPDKVHLTKKGYQIWGDSLRKELKKLIQP